ncbi:MAG: hypothetical protein IKJ42_05660 [Bacteroidaceae bacterium]|nr:hypothetical protein [Bacteroidaceae bacterium]
METEPGKAYKCLSEMEDVDNLSAEQRARYAFLYTQAMHECHIPFTNDSLINVAVEYFTRHNKNHYAAKALLYKGMIHTQYGIRNFEKAEKAFAQSEKWFKGIEDDQYKAMLYDQYATLLSYRGRYRDALPYFKNAYFFYSKLESFPEMLSANREIANIYVRLRDMENAKVYYEKGLQYKDKVPSLLYYFYLRDYANFFSISKEYEKAEQMLLECAQHINTKAVYDVYLKLAYLYLDKEEYDKMMVYTDKILRSNDSYWMYCCYRLLYLMCHQQGLYDDANRYYELYRQNVEKRAIEELDNWDIEIPLKQKNTLLIEENRVLSGWKLWLTIGAVTVVVASGVIFLFVKRRHLRYLLEKNQELTDASSNIWKLKGAMTNQAHVVERLKKAMGDMKKEHRDEICRMKEDMKCLEADIKVLKNKERENYTEKKELKRQLTDLEKQLKQKTESLEYTEEQRKIDLRIDYFVMHGRDSIAVDMLLQLRYGEEIRAKYDIRASEYLPILRGLLEVEDPALHHKLEGCGLPKNKMTMCYLIALGLDDVDMMSRAACLAPNSVKAYRKECREVIVALQIKN